MSVSLEWEAPSRAEIRRRREAGWRAEAEAFAQRFPVMTQDSSEDLTATWAEIERQFLDMAMTWDRPRVREAIREIAEMSEVVSGEQIIRWLIIVSRSMTTFDGQQPTSTPSPGAIERWDPSDASS